MSIRELIAAELKATLTAAAVNYGLISGGVTEAYDYGSITDQSVSAPVQVAYVTRDALDFKKLSNAQFPALLIETAAESREDVTIGESLKRQASVEYRIIGYSKGAEIDTIRNNLIEAIEEKLDADRTRGGNAIDTQVVSVDIDDGSISPIGGIILTVRVTYQYTRGIT